MDFSTLQNTVTHLEKCHAIFIGISQLGRSLPLSELLFSTMSEATRFPLHIQVTLYTNPQTLIEKFTPLLLE